MACAARHCQGSWQGDPAGGNSFAGACTSSYTKGYIGLQSEHMQHYHVSAALQCVVKLLGNKLVPCAVPSCAMVLAADRLAWPACVQPC